MSADGDSVKDLAPSTRGDSPTLGEQRSRQGSMSSQKGPGTPLARSGVATPTQARSRQGSMSSASPLQKQASVNSLARSAAASAAAAAEVMSPGLGSRKGSATSHVSHVSHATAPGALQTTSSHPAASAAGDHPLTKAPSERSVTGTAVPASALLAAESVPQEMEEPAPAPVPQEEFVPERELSVEERLARAEQEVEDARKRAHALEQTNASLQRLMASGTGDSKIKMLTQDLNKRGEKIKALEAEVRKQTKRADEAEAKSKAAALKDRRQSRSSVNLTGHSSNQDKAAIKDLQAKLDTAQSKLRASVPAVVDASGSSEAQKIITKLQTLLAEKEAEKQVLTQKLEQAQAAIVSSAGAGFENEVKLQQARSALQSILRSQSPQNTRSPSQPQSLRAMSPAAALLNPASTASLRQPHSITSTASRPRAYYDYGASPVQRYSSATPTYNSPLGVERRDKSPVRHYSSSPRF